MAKAEKTKVKQVVETEVDAVVLTLTPEEAGVLFRVVGSITGPSNPGNPRCCTDAIYDALSSARVSTVAVHFEGRMFIS